MVERVAVVALCRVAAAGISLGAVCREQLVAQLVEQGRARLRYQGEPRLNACS